MKEILKQQRWVYTLYKTEEGLLLSVVCGGVGMFEVDVLLSDSEGDLAMNDQNYLDELTEKIRSNPKAYKK